MVSQSSFFFGSLVFENSLPGCCLRFALRHSMHAFVSSCGCRQLDRHVMATMSEFGGHKSSCSGCVELEMGREHGELTLFCLRWRRQAVLQ